MVATETGNRFVDHVKVLGLEVHGDGPLLSIPLEVKPLEAEQVEGCATVDLHAYKGIDNIKPSCTWDNCNEVVTEKRALVKVTMT